MRKQTDRLLSDEVEILKGQIADEGRKRSDAVARLKACVDEATKEADATTRFYRASGETSRQELAGQVNGALERAKSESQAKRKAGLARLKKTTMQAVQTIRDTVFLDPEELKRRIESDDLGSED